MMDGIKELLEFARAEHHEHVQRFEEAIERLLSETGIPLEDLALVTEWKGINREETIRQRSTGRVLFTGRRQDAVFKMDT